MRFAIRVLLVVLTLGFVQAPPALAGLTSSKSASAPKGPIDLEPSPHLTPRQVVEIQLGGLAANHAWGDDRGIALAWRFASPDNRRFTGPFPRFVDMVRRGYGALLDHRAAQIGPLHPHGGSVFVPVLLQDAQGRDRAYIWVLTRQTEGSTRDCWMTDVVIEAQPRAIRPAVEAEPRTAQREF